MVDRFDLAQAQYDSELPEDRHARYPADDRDCEEEDANRRLLDTCANCEESDCRGNCDNEQGAEND